MDFIFFTLTTSIEAFIAGDQRWGVKFEFERLDFGYRDPDESYPDYTYGTLVLAKSCMPYDTILEWSPGTKSQLNKS